MGCFDSNCCLTGLPIKYGDPVRVSIILNDSSQETWRGSVASEWQFMLPPLASKYNDYGNIDYGDWNDKDSILAEIFLEIWAPGLELDKEYPAYELASRDRKDWTQKDIWNGCFCHSFTYDPGRSGREEIEAWRDAGSPEESTPPFRIRKPDGYPIMYTDQLEVAPWMCHAFAWDHLAGIGNRFMDKSVEQEIGYLFRTTRRVFRIIRQKYGDQAFGDASHPNHAEALAFFSRSAISGCDSILGEQGTFPHCMQKIIQDMEDWNPDLELSLQKNRLAIKSAIAETVQATYNMLLIRKPITPMCTVGPQHDEYDYLKGWSKMVADKCESMYLARQEDY